MADKLSAPAAHTLVDRCPSSHRLPRQPSRPPALAPHSNTVRLPRPDALRSEADRARILHALVNHELQALELFACALLRFPDAPAALRRGWAVTMLDEQRHMASYLQRLETCGGELGQQPVSGFFWNALHDAPDPLSFVTGLEVCLEQANLDFARVWAAAFRRAGDAATATVLDEVYEDEIRHVRLGMTWMRRLGQPGDTDWHTFTRALRFPLTPARARGPQLDREGRRRAGIDDGFIEQLATTEVSRGRVPRLLWFNPGVEDEIAGRSATAGQRAVQQELAVLIGLAARSGDAVVAPRPPTSFLSAWRGIGLVVPQFVEQLGARQLPDERVAEVVPWGWSPQVAAACAVHGGRWEPRWRQLHSKAWAAERLVHWSRQHPGLVAPEHLGVVCTSEHAVEEALQRMAEAPGDTCWIKAAFSAAGRHRLRVHRLEPPQRTWLQRALQQGEVVVERHLDVRAELSAQVEIGDDGVRLRGVVRFGACRAVFRGAVVGKPTHGLPSDVLRAVHQHTLLDRLGAAATWVGEQAAERGYRGPLGVDALLVQHEGEVRLKPVSEINPRLTMGRLCLEVQRRVRGVGGWLFLPVRALTAAGTDPVDFLRRAQGRVEVVVATNPPEQARHVLTVLWLSATHRAGVHAWRQLLASLPGDPSALERATAWLSVD
ncbi:MAG: ferritin-like domain-containing protein [Myxococcales bacterium]|nr:ferritin-like domain-containing protein [Myxococcales bacterium]